MATINKACMSPVRFQFTSGQFQNPIFGYNYHATGDPQSADPDVPIVHAVSTDWGAEGIFPAVNAPSLTPAAAGQCEFYYMNWCENTRVRLSAGNVLNLASDPLPDHVSHIDSQRATSGFVAEPVQLPTKCRMLDLGIGAKLVGTRDIADIGTRCPDMYRLVLSTNLDVLGSLNGFLAGQSDSSAIDWIRILGGSNAVAYDATNINTELPNCRALELSSAGSSCSIADYSTIALPNLERFSVSSNPLNTAAVNMETFLANNPNMRYLSFIGRHSAINGNLNTALGSLTTPSSALLFQLIVGTTGGNMALVANLDTIFPLFSSLSTIVVSAATGQGVGTLFSGDWATFLAGHQNLQSLHTTRFNLPNDMTCTTVPTFPNAMRDVTWKQRTTALSQTELNNFLTGLDAVATWTTTPTVLIDGSNMPIPDAANLALISSLQGKGVSVTHNT